MKKQILSVGIGWFAIQAIWTTYNAFMPLMYQRLTAIPDPVTGAIVPNLFLVGLLMTTDNITGLLLGPFWGARSDRTQTRFGRRKPYILIGMPLAALLVWTLPSLALISLAALVAGAVLMNIAMTVFRSPISAYLSDLFPKSIRAQVSGATDLCAGIGAIITLLAGGRLYAMNPSYPFLMVGVFLLIATVVIYWGVREPEKPGPDAEAAETSGDLPPTIPAAVQTLMQIPEKSPLLFLGALFFIWTAWNAIESFWTTYATTALKMEGGDAATFAAILALSYLVGAVPAGFAAARFGRHRTILAGLVLLIPLYLIGALNTSVTAFAILLGLMGICWSFVLVNGIVMFQEFASPRQIGLFSGIYAIGTALAQIAGPPSYGFLMDRFGPQALWFAGLTALIIGTAIVGRVREGRVYVSGGAVAAG
jgi:maltose/moltooligosaccharide transporter